MNLAQARTRPASTTRMPAISSPGKLALSALNWLADKDRSYRDRQHLKSLTDTQLKDVGLTRWMIG